MHLYLQCQKDVLQAKYKSLFSLFLNKKSIIFTVSNNNNSLISKI